MKKKLKQEWIEALNSGEYQQGQTYLYKDKRYCCLGVLCEVMGLNREGIGYLSPNSDMIMNTHLFADVLKKIKLKAGFRITSATGIFQEVEISRLRNKKNESTNFIEVNISRATTKYLKIRI